MIACLTGTVAAQYDGYVILATPSGVGYEVRINPAWQLDSQTTLYTWQIFNEADHQDVLFGFLAARDRELARLVAETDGVGPGKAHKLVSVAGFDCIIRAVQSGHIDELQQVMSGKGIGPKFLQSIVKKLSEKGQFEDSGSAHHISTVRMALGALGVHISNVDALVSQILLENPKATPEVIIGKLLAKTKS